jgi:hypothetical protein
LDRHPAIAMLLADLAGEASARKPVAAGSSSELGPLVEG